METAVFALFALLALGSALVVVAHRSPVYALMSLVLTLFSLAVLFVLLGAPFIAALQVLIYAGAILVLFLFVVMLLNLQREEGAGGHAAQRWAAVLGAGLFGGMLATLFWRTYRDTDAAPLSERLVSLHALARGLFEEFLLPFEIVGLLLLVAVVAATIVARRVDQIAPTAQPAPTAPAQSAIPFGERKGEP